MSVGTLSILSSVALACIFISGAVPLTETAATQTIVEETTALKQGQLARGSAAVRKI